MIHTQDSLAQRRGFTLVELLVVIAIISVLMALLLPAVFGLLGKGKEIKTVEEISQFALAIEDFKREYKVDYIPSKIKLCERLSDYGTSLLDNDSKSYLLTVWPHIGEKWAQETTIDWNGDGAATGPMTLEGDQCLVYFLAGPRNLGFASDPRDPIKLAQAQGRKGPFFKKFEAGRLRPRAGNAAGTAGYMSYYDNYSINDPTKDQPYAYFSSNGIANGYSRFGGSDCATLVGTPAPYMEATNPATRYYNASSFQIVSAGVNQQFGPGGLWTPQTAGSINAAGADDQSNFYDRMMGVSK